MCSRMVARMLGAPILDFYKELTGGMCCVAPAQAALAEREAELAALQQQHLAGGARATEALEARLHEQAALLTETTRVRALPLAVLLSL